MTRRAVWMLCTLALAGCGGLLPAAAPPPLRFTLGPAPDVALAAGPRPTVARTLQVSAPRPAPGYDGEQMLYLQAPQTLAPFAFHAWVAPPAQLLAPMMVQALQGSGLFAAVLPASSSGSASWRLESELITLHQDFSARPSQVQLTLQVRLLDGATRRVIAAREITRRVPAASDDPVAGAAAARVATQQVLAELVAFCAAEAAR
jgi:cholesterol transport system auxiliary component